MPKCPIFNCQRPLFIPTVIDHQCGQSEYCDVTALFSIFLQTNYQSLMRLMHSIVMYNTAWLTWPYSLHRNQINTTQWIFRILRDSLDLHAVSLIKQFYAHIAFIHVYLDNIVILLLLPWQ